MEHSNTNSKSGRGTIQFYNTTFRETNGVHKSTTIQNITRHIDVGNVEDTHISTTIKKTKIFVNKPHDETPPPESTEDTVACSNPVNLTDLVDVPPEKFDLAKTMALLRSGKAVFCNEPSTTGGHESSSSSGDSGARRSGDGPSSTASDSGSYQDFRSTPFTPFIEKLHKIDFIDRKNLKKAVNKKWIDTVGDLSKAAQQAGDGQHLPGYSSHTLEHTMLHNGTSINPDVRFQRIDGTLEVYTEEDHTVNVNSWNVSNLTYTKHTEVKSTTKEGGRKY